MNKPPRTIESNFDWYGILAEKTLVRMRCIPHRIDTENWSFADSPYWSEKIDRNEGISG